MATTWSGRGAATRSTSSATATSAKPGSPSDRITEDVRPVDRSVSPRVREGRRSVGYQEGARVRRGRGRQTPRPRVPTSRGAAEEREVAGRPRRCAPRTPQGEQHPAARLPSRRDPQRGPERTARVSYLLIDEALELLDL